MSTERADEQIHRAEILPYSILVLLDRLNAKERAVFILKEAFDYSREEIAETLSVFCREFQEAIQRGKEGAKQTCKF